MKVITEFKGQSGCRVVLIEKEGMLCVRKQTTNPEVIGRLKTQYQKLKMLQGLRWAKAPELLGEYEQDGTFFFDMQYCERSLPFADAAEEMSLCELRGLADFLVSLLLELAAVPVFEKSKKFGSANLEKLNTIIENPKMRRYPEVVSCLEVLLANHEKYFGPILNLESRFCHGDLTMDNILWDIKGKKWLIDPIDSFFEHPWCDIAKLYQDIEGEWFQIRNQVHQRRASSNLWRIGSVLKEGICEKHPQYLNYHYYFLGLNFARILPYVSDTRVSDVITSKTQLFLRKFMEGKKL